VDTTERNLGMPLRVPLVASLVELATAPGSLSPWSSLPSPIAGSAQLDSATRVGHPVAARHGGGAEEDVAMSDARDAARQPDPNQLFIADSSAHGGPGRPEMALMKLLTVLGRGVRALVARLRR
jgi:hypothetical protein